MPDPDLNDLVAFLAVADAQNFTKAAAKLGVSQSALSQTVRGLEARLGLRLFTRTTRSVSSTEAGERLSRAVAPRIDAIRSELAALGELRDKPAGTVRISADEHAATMVLWPGLAEILPNYPDIKVELAVGNGLIDIVAERYDAGVRTGNIVAKDMIAVPIGPDIRTVVVGSPAYFAGRARPKTPQDLTEHACINLRLPTHGGLYAWEFQKAGRALRVRVDGQLVFNNMALMLTAALDGFGLAFLAQDQVQSHLDGGRLIQVLTSWCPPFAGHHLYYPSRRQSSPALAALVDGLRRRHARMYAGAMSSRAMSPPARRR